MKNLTHFELKKIQVSKTTFLRITNDYCIESSNKYKKIQRSFCFVCNKWTVHLPTIIMSETVNVKNMESLVSEKMDGEQENEPEKKLKKVRIENLNLLSSTIVLGKKE